MEQEKNVYFQAREKLQLTRDQAIKKLEGISADRLERIENERQLPQPYDVLSMAKGYNAPELCNFYCANQCPIGIEYVPEVKVKSISQIVLSMLSSLHKLKKEKERLVEIMADEIVDDSEIVDFVRIQENLVEISLTVQSMLLWTEKMVTEGKINTEKYYELKTK